MSGPDVSTQLVIGTVAKDIQKIWPQTFQTLLNQFASKHGIDINEVNSAASSPEKWTRISRQDRAAGRRVMWLADRMGQLGNLTHNIDVPDEVVEIVGLAIAGWMPDFKDNLRDIYQRALRKHVRGMPLPVQGEQDRLLYLSSIVREDLQKWPHVLPEGNLLDAFLNDLLLR